MSDVIPFPVPHARKNHDLDAIIDTALAGIPEKARAKIRFELIKTVDSYDAFFTQWSLSLPDEGDETLKKQIYDIAHEEHDRKMRMLADIIRLRIQVLVSEYRQRKY